MCRFSCKRTIIITKRSNELRKSRLTEIWHQVYALIHRESRCDLDGSGAVEEENNRFTEEQRGASRAIEGQNPGAMLCLLHKHSEFCATFETRQEKEAELAVATIVIRPQEICRTRNGPDKSSSSLIWKVPHRRDRGFQRVGAQSHRIPKEQCAEEGNQESATPIIDL